VKPKKQTLIYRMEESCNFDSDVRILPRDFAVIDSR